MGVCMFDLVNNISLPNNVNSNVLLTDIPLEIPSVIEETPTTPTPIISNTTITSTIPTITTSTIPTTTTTSTTNDTFVNTTKKSKYDNLTNMNNDKQFITILLVFGIILLIIYISKNCNNSTIASATKYVSNPGVINLF